MKKQKLMILTALMLVGLAGTAFSEVAGYATYWDAAGDGYGGGIKLMKIFLGFLAADLRGGYVEFDSSKTSVIPLEASVMLRLPFFIEPYIGVGAGYYNASSDVLNISSSGGIFALAGVQVNFLAVGAFAEVRRMDLEENLLDGTSANIGLAWRW
jgi:hypothetical protein